MSSQQKLGADELPEPITVSVATALRILGLGRSKFYELIQDEEIEVVKVGRRTLVLMASILSFVESRRVRRSSLGKFTP